jgi:hypothetical protein
LIQDVVAFTLTPLGTFIVPNGAYLFVIEKTDGYFTHLTPRFLFSIPQTCVRDKINHNYMWRYNPISICGFPFFCLAALLLWVQYEVHFFSYDPALQHLSFCARPSFRPCRRFPPPRRCSLFPYRYAPFPSFSDSPSLIAASIVPSTMDKYFSGNAEGQGKN